jgi:DNA-binding LacI/PurR family transcriptional regulator
MTIAEPTTLHAVAEATQLSIATVSKILGGKYKGNTPKGRERVSRVLETAKRLGYVANASARRLRGGAHHAVIVVMPVDEYGHPAMFTIEFLLGINSALRERKTSVILHTYPREGSLEQGPSLPADRTYDGAVVIDEARDIGDRLTRMGVPVAFINTALGAGPMSFVRDERAAGGDLARSLIDLGYRRLLVVGEIDGGHICYPERWRGITAVASAAGIPVEVIPDAWWTGALWRKVPQHPIAPGTAVVATDVHTFLQLQRMLPPSTPLAACDDCHFLFETRRDLTRVRFDRMALGRMAAEHLLARVADPRFSEVVPAMRGEVIVGPSTPRYIA